MKHVKCYLETCKLWTLVIIHFADKTFWETPASMNENKKEKQIRADYIYQYKQMDMNTFICN